MWSICQCSCTTLSCRVGSLIPTETETASKLPISTGGESEERYFSHKRYCQSETASKLPISTGGESEDKRGISHTNVTVNLKQHQNCLSVQEGKVKTREVFLTQTLLSICTVIYTGGWGVGGTI